MIRRYTFTVTLDEKPDEDGQHRERQEIMSMLDAALMALEDEDDERLTVSAQLKDVQSIPT